LDTDLGGTDDVVSPTASQKDGKTEVTFSHKLVTKDTWDSPFTIGPVKIIWAIGMDQFLGYHGDQPQNRGSKIIDFFENDVCGPKMGCTSCLTNSKCVYCGSDKLCYDKTNTGKCDQLNTTCTKETKAPQVCANPLPNAWVPPGYCASIWATNLNAPRGLVTASNGDILVVESRINQITVLWNASGQIQRARLAGGSGINHGIAISNDFVYASNPTTVFRWKYMAGQREDLGAAETVVYNVPCCHHSTRSLAFDRQGRLYVSVGSASNVDPDSTHARIVRFDVGNVPSGGINWNAGFLFADGLRNEVGITFDAQDRLWGVENGCDNLNRADLGGDIHINNPSEEVNLFDVPGRFYGYPYCWSEYTLPTFGQGRGSQWLHPDFTGDGVHTDAWCKNPANVVKPEYNMLAHTAPLDIKFNSYDTFPGFPVGGAFVSLHGSWNRQPPAGYRIIYLTFANGLPTGETVLIRNSGTSQNWPNNIRPVGITFNTCNENSNCLYFSSDSSGHIIEIRFDGTK